MCRRFETSARKRAYSKLTKNLRQTYRTVIPNPTRPRISYKRPRMILLPPKTG